jgi:hypothetical protein
MKIEFFFLKRALLIRLPLSCVFVKKSEKIGHVHFIYVHLYWKKCLLHILLQRNIGGIFFFFSIFYPF